MWQRIGIGIFFIFLFIFSFWLMFHTFSYDTNRGSLLISAKAWSDFGGYIPQIRSFSIGKNWPPQYPLFPGEPTRYHFLFYLIVGLMEKLGLRIDLALNILSGVGFFLLLFAIWTLSQQLFSSRRVSLLSVIFLLFNGSFSWLDYLKLNNYSLASAVSKLPALSQFPSFGPWNGSWITAFWNLNIYTNQRHLAFSYALCIFLIIILNAKHRYLPMLTGLILGAFLVLNQAVFAIAVVVSAWYFLIRPHLRKPMFISLVGFFPWLYLFQFISHSGQTFPFHAGYLVPGQLSVLSFIEFWFLNIGLHSLFIPLGIFLAPPKSRHFFIPLLLLFIIPNLIQLSPDMINNHKLFNFVFIVGQIFSAYALVYIWDKFHLLRPLVPLAFFFLILGGIVDFFPVKNDYYLNLPDLSSNPDANFFARHTPPDSVVLNSTWFYHPASLAGRFIFNGYSYFTWSFGYDQVTRESQTTAIYGSLSKSVACQLLKKNHISYVELSPNPESFIHPNWQMWKKSFVPLYTNPTSGLTVYSTLQNCSYNE
jgi:hypothetical protein